MTEASKGAPGQIWVKHASRAVSCCVQSHEGSRMVDVGRAEWVAPFMPGRSMQD